MRTRVRTSEQVESFVKSLAPEPRRALTRALKALAHSKGDIRQLEGALDGFARLRVAGFRVIFSSRAEGGQRIIECLFVERRAVIYELFEAELRRLLHRRSLTPRSP